ncbi:MAG: thioredoxin [Bryobacterales bacterium]
MAEQKSYITLTDANFQKEVIESDVPVLVDFWAAWCGPCIALGPAIEQLAEEFQGKVKVGKVNVDDNPAVSQKFGVRSIPTILIFEGGQVVDQQIGLAPKAQLAKKLNSLQAA